MIVLASGPSVGKSTLALNIARHAAGQGSNVGIFSLEMSREQIGHRLLSSEAEVDLRNVRQRLYGDVAERRIVNAAGTLSELPIFIDDTPLQSIVEIRSKARRLHMERKLDLVIVDYLQLVQGTGRSSIFSSSGPKRRLGTGVNLELSGNPSEKTITSPGKLGGPRIGP